MTIWDRIPDKQNSEELIILSQLAHSNILAPYKTQRETKDGLIVDVFVTATSLINKEGNIYAIATTERLYKSTP